MALEGSLKEFNVADILQLIFFQKKTGALLLLGKTDRVRILFVDGNIVGADSRKRTVEKRLGMILLKRKIVSREDIMAAIEKQRAEGGKFGHIMVKEGLITKEQVQEILTFQISEILGQIFGMKEGRYEFKPQSVPVDKEMGVVLNTEHFLMEGVRLVDEWSQIEGRITLDDVFLQTEDAAGAELNETEARIMELVDGEHDIADITDVSGLDSFTVSSTILTMVERGLLLRYDAEAEAAAAELEKAKAKRVVHPIAGLKGIIIVIILVSFLGGTSLLFYLSRGLTVYTASEKLDRLRTDVEVVFHASGAYPLSRQVGLDPWGNPVVYSAKDGSYLLYMTGPDGRAGTPDDLPVLPYNVLFPPKPVEPPAPAELQPPAPTDPAPQAQPQGQQ